MTPKEKAKDIIQKFIRYSEKDISGEYESYYLTKLSSAKKCALIALDITFEFSDDSFRSCYDYESTEEYLKEVKKEIEKL